MRLQSWQASDVREFNDNNIMSQSPLSEYFIGEQYIPHIRTQKLLRIDNVGCCSEGYSWNTTEMSCNVQIAGQ